MSSPNKMPFFKDAYHMSGAQRRVGAAAPASAVDGRVDSNGTAPVSLGVLTVFGVVVLIAGGILGGAGRFFDYRTMFRAGYERIPAPGEGDAQPPPKAALASYMARGAKIYAAKCIVCHGPEAKGDGINFPALAGSTWATGETQRFAMIILNGLQGPISNGKSYGAGMPSQAAGLTPEDVAGVMTYVRNNFGNNTGDIVTVAMAKAALEISAARAKAGQQVTAAELTADHRKALPGPPLDPTALVNPITLTPVRTSAPASAAPKP
ncbi:MAG: cytochrome c [Verrucomicrobia bacterium]|nr:cytochrome c [Verrucomicrobiota bacterium]